MNPSVQRISLFLLLLLSGALNGQGFLERVQFGDADNFDNLPERSLLVKTGEVNEGTPQVREIVLDGDYLNINVQALSAVLNATDSREVIKIDRGHESIELWLIESPVITTQFSVFAASNPVLPVGTETKLYWGVVKDQPGSFVSLAVFEDEVMGFFNVNGEDYTLGKLENSDQHILYKNEDLLVPNESGCAVDEALHDKSGLRSDAPGGSRDASNCVNMYVEANHNIYQDKGSVAATTNYVLGLFNQVGILYANELINFSVSELLVWDVPSPYNGPNSGDYLVQFRNSLGGSYNGDLAHLVGYGGGGGVAYLDVLCIPYWGIGYSGINSGYNNVPAYSWSVMVVAHEIGHNLGSPHTHNCSWNGEGNNAIDGCGPTAGYSEGCDGPLPSAGTIMSYCHLISGVGIDLALGFGTQPGDLIRNEVYNATCLGDCITVYDCQDPYNLTAVNITDTEIELSWGSGGVASSWDIEYGLENFTFTGIPTVSSVGKPYLVSGLNPDTNYDFYVRGICDGGEHSNWIGPLTVTTLATCPTPELIAADNITTSSLELSWNQLLTANSWDIEYGIAGFTPSGTPTESGVSNPHTINGLTSGASYTFYVRANCDGNEQSGWSEPATFTIVCDGNYAIPFTETFEISSVSRSCWTQFIESWGEQGGTGGEGELWTYQQGSSGGSINNAYEGDLNARYVSYQTDGTSSPVAKLISPELDLSGYDMIELSFFYGQELWYNDQNELKVYYKSSPQDVWTELAHFTDNVDTWTQFVVPLENFSSTYRIAFEGINNWGRANVVDQVEVRPIPFTNLDETACDSYTLNGETFTESGFYTQTLVSAGGGDSLVFLNLTILESTSSGLTVSTCGEFNLNGSNYSESGQYTQVIPNAAGCDSTITLNLTITGEFDDCGECIAGGSTDPNWNQSCADCNGDPDGSAFIDNCNNCVGGNTGQTACVQDCNGEWGGTAYLDNCNACVGGTTGSTPCTADCNGDFGGSAFIDNCNNCVGGNTGQTACVQDCNGEWGGSAFLDNCNACVGGSTGNTPCTADCNGDFGGSAFIDNCNNCVGGNTGQTACVQDCNGEWGGSAFLDNCNACVGGSTGNTPCTADCNGDFGGTAFIDNCNNCVGGNTGQTACVQDCNGEWGGSAFLDNCNACVGGSTGNTPCTADCNGDFGGTAFIDNCNNCVGGNTGQTACVQDCNGEWGGTAFLDDCDLCVGGTTGEEPCCTLEIVTESSPADIGFANGSASVNVSGGTAPYSYQWNDPFFQTSETAIGLFTGIYTCEVSDSEGCVVIVEVEVLLASIIPSTGVSSHFCNTSGHALSDFISCNLVQGADAYRWEFAIQGGDALPEFTRYGGNKWIRLQWVSGIAHGVTYDVRVKARVGGVWGDFSNVCEITTATTVPQTEVRFEYHPTNAQGNPYSLCDFILAYSVSNATNYRWRFDPDTDPNNGNEVIYTRGTGNSATRLSWVNGLIPGVNYHVAVEAAIGSNWSGFGAVHEITIDGPPQPALRAAFCNETYSPNQYVLSHSVCAANYYQFQFEPVGGGTISTRTSGNYVCFLSGVSPALSPGDYNVRVRVNQGGVLGEWGAPCIITIGGPGQEQNNSPALREHVVQQTPVLFPNPNRGDEVRVYLDELSDEQHQVELGVFNIYGQRINAMTFGQFGSVIDRVVRFNEGLAPGMYLVQIAVDDEPTVATRLIVQ